MSAFMHTARHISAVVNTAKAIGAIDDAEAAFKVLRRANAESIHARYGDKRAYSIKGCGPYDPAAPVLTREDLHWACRSIRYQSCEYTGWDRSTASTLLARIQAAGDALPANDPRFGRTPVEHNWSI